MLYKVNNRKLCSYFSSVLTFANIWYVWLKTPMRVVNDVEVKAIHRSNYFSENNNFTY